MTSRVGPTHADRLLYLLVLRCQAGDEAAFGQLLTSFGSRTLAHLRTLVGDEAEDVQQEVWLAVYRRIGSLANPGGFRTWLFQTTRHRAIDYLRARRRELVLMIPSTLIATLSTVGIFLRLRTASLQEIQLRLAALEAMLTRDDSANSPQSHRG